MLAAVGSVTAMVVSKPSAVAPSSINGFAPCTVPFIVTRSVASAPNNTLSSACKVPVISTPALASTLPPKVTWPTVCVSACPVTFKAAPVTSKPPVASTLPAKLT